MWSMIFKDSNGSDKEFTGLDCEHDRKHNDQPANYWMFLNTENYWQ
jgi:hypothetical protein